MPFPWKKKSRVTRISRIVADLQSPKRGGSLVVQTGFPTSLIDLFVKNRSRFARPKPKKPGRLEEIPDPPPPPPPPSPATSPPPPIPTLSPRPEAPTPGPLIRQEYADTDVASGRVIELGSGSGNRVVGVAVRIIMVLVLIASVERLTVGITVSAFALLFLEYAAKRSVSCTRPCALFQKLLLLQPKLKKEEEEEEESELAKFQGELTELTSGSSRVFDEIEVVETNIEESCGAVGPEWGLVGGDVAWGSSELVEEVDNDDADSSKGKVVMEASSSSSCEVFYDCKASQGSRGNFRFKSKMVKKLVPKKFRGSKKEKKMEKMGKEGEAESGSEVSTSSAVEEDKPMSFEIEEETRNVGKSKLECIRDDDDVDEVDCGINGSQGSSLVMEVVDVYDEGKRIGRVGNSGYIVLLVIALTGLLVGRFQALILTMAWCFMLKVVKTLWRTLDVPWL